ncbi:hypothetical protein [Alloprevotella tannerae]|uniref:hypothetical protein n=1 Tax=Alloprevotella tannerae TaxID=76122 RepID=UPI0028CFE92F|nr:hypothetical protein [Alloprevotella tannerae]
MNGSFPHRPWPDATPSGGVCLCAGRLPKTVGGGERFDYLPIAADCRRWKSFSAAAIF